MQLPKGGCDVFFCDEYSSSAKAGSPDAAGFVQVRGRGAGITELRDGAIQWGWTDAVESWASRNRASASGTAETTTARILLRSGGQAWEQTARSQGRSLLCRSAAGRVAGMG